MTLPNHPDDERLAALAGIDPAATSDGDVRDHVAGCERCRALTGDLSMLRSALAELPEIALPSHLPAFVLPPLAAERREPRPAPRGGFLENLRRALVPAMAAGAALALVGAVGTSGYLDSLTRTAGGDLAMPAMAPDDGEGSAAGGAEGAEIEAESTDSTAEMYVTRSEADDTAQNGGVPAVWVTLIIAGVAIVVGAILLRRALPRPST